MITTNHVAVPVNTWAWVTYGGWVYSDSLSDCPNNTKLWFRTHTTATWTTFEDKEAAEKTKQTNQTERKDSMTTVIIVTETPSPLDAQKGVNEKIIAGPETVVARDNNVALLIFGANHAEEIKAASSDRMVVQYRQGV